MVEPSPAREDGAVGEVVQIGLTSDEAKELASLRLIRAVFGCELRPDLERRYLYLARRGSVADQWRATG